MCPGVLLVKEPSLANLLRNTFSSFLDVELSLFFTKVFLFLVKPSSVTALIIFPFLLQTPTSARGGSSEARSRARGEAEGDFAVVESRSMVFLAELVGVSVVAWKVREDGENVVFEVVFLAIDKVVSSEGGTPRGRFPLREGRQEVLQWERSS